VTHATSNARIVIGNLPCKVIWADTHSRQLSVASG
jgi:hypothetical protein